MGIKKSNISVLFLALICVFIIIAGITHKIILKEKKAAVVFSEKDMTEASPEQIQQVQTIYNLFDTASSLQRQSQYQDALSFYKKIISEYPDSILADNAYYNIAEILNSPKIQRPQDAIAVYQIIVDKYPESETADDAQYAIIKTREQQLGQSLLALTECEKLVDLFPESKYAGYAKSIIEQMNSDTDGDGYTEKQHIQMNLPSESFEDKVETQPQTLEVILEEILNEE